MKASVSPHPVPDTFSCFNLSILKGIKGNLIVALLCMSLITVDVEHVVTRFLAIRISLRKIISILDTQMPFSLAFFWFMATFQTMNFDCANFFGYCLGFEVKRKQ